MFYFITEKINFIQFFNSNKSFLFRSSIRGIIFLNYILIVDNFGIENSGKYSFALLVALLLGFIILFGFHESFSLNLIKSNSYCPVRKKINFSPHFFILFFVFVVLVSIQFYIFNFYFFVFHAVIVQIFFKSFFSIFRSRKKVNRILFFIEFLPSFFILILLLIFETSNLKFLFLFKNISDSMAILILLCNFKIEYNYFIKEYFEIFKFSKFKTQFIIFLNDFLGSFLLEMPIFFLGIFNSFYLAGLYKLSKNFLSPLQILFSTKKIYAYRDILSLEKFPKIYFLDLVLGFLWITICYFFFIYSKRLNLNDSGYFLVFSVFLLFNLVSFEFNITSILPVFRNFYILSVLLVYLFSFILIYLQFYFLGVNAILIFPVFSLIIRVLVHKTNYLT